MNVAFADAKVGTDNMHLLENKRVMLRVWATRWQTKFIKKYKFFVGNI